MDQVYSTLGEASIQIVDEDQRDKELFEQALSDIGLDDPVKMYLKDIGRVPLLTAEEEIDLANFIVRNFTEYKGDDTFLSKPSAKTKAVWSRCEKLLEEENKNGGCLDVETNILSGITAFAPGYIDKENEVIVGLQTDAPLKRIVNMYGGTKVAMKALESHGYKLNDDVYKHFTTYRKTHNDGVFDAYTPSGRPVKRPFERALLIAGV